MLVCLRIEKRLLYLGYLGRPSRLFMGWFWCCWFAFGVACPSSVSRWAYAYVRSLHGGMRGLMTLPFAAFSRTHLERPLCLVLPTMLCVARVEFPRDPLREPGPDENMRQRGGFQRLMAATTFESPFAKKKNKTAGIGYSPLELDEVRCSATTCVCVCVCDCPTTSLRLCSFGCVYFVLVIQQWCAGLTRR